MEKNTVWAIVLSVLVIIVSSVFMPKWFGLDQAPVEETVVETTVEKTETEKTMSDAISESTSEITEVEEVVETRTEETIVVKTNKAEIVLTNKGADIISYTLDPETHKDFQTGKGVELSDNVNPRNRTCAISLGGAENTIIDDLFDVKKIDDYTYLFTRDITYGGKKFTLGKKYTFTPNEYMFKLEVLIHDPSAQGLNYNDIAYTIRTSPQIGPHFDRKRDRYEYRQFVTYNGKKAKKDNLIDGNFKHLDKDINWGGIAGKYFIELVIPTDNSIIKNSAYSTKVEVNEYANAQAFFERRSFAASDIKDTYFMYFGPRSEKEMEIYNQSDKNEWKISGFKITEAMQSSGFFSWIESILKWCLETLHLVFKNWGVCIILLTLILKVLLFPLSKKQSLGSLKMQELQPQVQAIQKKYANDQQRMQQEMSKLYQEAHYNPASGCLPLILQFFILISMYNLFNTYFEFRGASFIKGWIPDLSTGDSVYTITKEIPVITTFFRFTNIRILPVIYVATQLLSGKITQNGGMNATSTTQMKFMTYGLPIIFFFILYNAPSGLILYWLTSNILQIGQQVLINRMMKEKRASTAKVIPAKNGKSRK